MAKRLEVYEWRKKNPTAYKAIERKAKRKYHRERRRVDTAYRLKANLRTRLYQALHVYKCVKRNISAVRDLGCSIEEFRAHIASQFTDGMSWDNYGGKDGWQVDHIKPLALYDLTDIEQARAACHFTNLQPLWAADNNHKRAHYALAG